MGGGLKAALRPFAAGLLNTRARMSGRRLGLVLCYHRIESRAGDPESELVPAIARPMFARQLRLLTRRYRLVPASELLAAVEARRRGRRLPVAITFDDDLQTHVDYAAPALRAAGAPATFFLNGASLRAAHRFWWERLQQAWDQGSPRDEIGRLTGAARAPATIREAATRFQQLTSGDREQASLRLAELVGEDPLDSGLREDGVKALACAGFELGFHSLRHDQLTSLGDGHLDRAMRDGREALERVAGGRFETISYPHGEGDARVAAAARRAGFRYGFTAYGRAVATDSEPLLLDRRYPPEGSLGRFALGVARALCAPRSGGVSSGSRPPAPVRTRPWP